MEYNKIESNEDDEILQGCLNNNGKFQKKLYEKYYSYGMSVCMRYVNNIDDAKALLNESFFKVFKYLSNFDITKPFIPWLKKIIINTAINKSKKELKYNDNKLDEIDEIGDFKTEDVLSKLSYDEIIKEIQSLPPAYKLTLNLFIIEGYKHHEIAEMLGVTEGTSKSNLFKAKAILKKKLINK